MVRRRRMADADAAAQQDRHLQPAVTHVLHFGNLVEDLPDGVQDKVGEHEVDDGPRAGHRGPTAQADETAFADRRVAKPFRTVQVEQSGGALEIAAALANAFAEYED